MTTHIYDPPPMPKLDDIPNDPMMSYNLNEDSLCRKFNGGDRREWDCTDCIEIRDDQLYGKELILDLKECNPELFNRHSLRTYFEGLCSAINMEMCDIHFWDDQGIPPDEKQTNPKTTGTSAICFIITSNITVHTLDKLRSVYINIFSCKLFNTEMAAAFSEEWFNANPKLTVQTIIDRT